MTEGESSKLMEATEPKKEESSVKRKAESDPAEESGDEIEDVEEDPLLKPTWWTAPVWGEDSYEEVEYHSSQEENKFDDPEHERLWRRCKRQLIETKGFYLEPELIPWSNFSQLKTVTDLELPAAFGLTHRQYYAGLACLCLQKYNKQEGSNVEFVEVVSGFYTKGPRWKSYITFMAREKPHGPLVEYQAKTWSTFVEGENYPILCRPAKSSP